MFRIFCNKQNTNKLSGISIVISKVDVGIYFKILFDLGMLPKMVVYHLIISPRRILKTPKFSSHLSAVIFDNFLGITNHDPKKSVMKLHLYSSIVSNQFLFVIYMFLNKARRCVEIPSVSIINYVRENFSKIEHKKF